MTTKPPWTLDQWTAFGLRCQALKPRVATLPAVLSGTPGLKAGTLDAVLAIERRLFLAMDRTANVVALQHGERDDLLSFIHGQAPGAARNAAILEACRPHPGPTGKLPCMSREQWTAFVAEVRSIRDEVWALVLDVQATRFGRKAVQPFAQVGWSIDRAKCRLDNLVLVQHPDWSEFARVFYGECSPVPRG